MGGDDEIVREVRRIRAQIFREAGGTLESYFKYIKQREKAEKSHTLVDFSKGMRRKSSRRSKASRAKAKRKRAKR